MALCSPGPHIAGSWAVTQSFPGGQREVPEPRLHRCSPQAVLRVARCGGGAGLSPTHIFQVAYCCVLSSCSLPELFCRFTLRGSPLARMCMGRQLRGRNEYVQWSAWSPALPETPPWPLHPGRGSPAHLGPQDLVSSVWCARGQHQIPLSLMVYCRGSLLVQTLARLL